MRKMDKEALALVTELYQGANNLIQALLTAKDSDSKIDPYEWAEVFTAMTMSAMAVKNRIVLIDRKGSLADFADSFSNIQISVKEESPNVKA